MAPATPAGTGGGGPVGDGGGRAAGRPPPSGWSGPRSGRRSDWAFWAAATLALNGLRWPRGLGRRGGRLLLRHDGLDVGVDAVERALVLAGQVSRPGSRTPAGCRGWRWPRLCCCCSAAWVACSWVWAVCRLSMVVVTLPVAMDEYSYRMPVVLGSDENIWVTWLVVPLLV